MALFKKKTKQEPLFKKKPAYKQQQKKPKTKMILAVIAVIIIAAIALYAFFVLQVSETVINTPTTVNITQQGNLYSINSNQYFISLSQASLSNDNAHITITKLPVFINPLLNVSLTLNNITKINVGANYSNIGLQLLSLTPTSAMVSISPLFPSLQIAPDTNKISVTQTTLSNSSSPSQTQMGTPNATTTLFTTTISATTATTTAQTTTIAVNNTAQEISTALKENDVYALLLNFSVLYANTTRCTPPIYNTSYVRENGNLPPGPSSFANVTPYVPYNLSSTESYSGDGNYDVIYKTKTINSFYNNSVASQLNVNTSAETVTSANFSGVFMDLNYQQLVMNYEQAQTVGGPCGVSVP
jgi:hypothetical protein